LWSDLVSRVGALYPGLNLIAHFPLGRNCPGKIADYDYD